MKAGIWRTQSGSWFAAIVLVVLLVQITAATLLTWSFIDQSLGKVSAFSAKTLVIGGITTGAMALLALTVYLLGFHVIAEKRRRLHEIESEHWTTRWVSVLFEQEDCPKGPLSRAAQGALVALTESMKGPEAVRLRALIALYGIDERLVNEISSSDPRRRRDALEGLAMARLPQALDALISSMVDARPEIRAMAARAASRTIASISSSQGREHFALRFGDALVEGGLARGVVEEMLLLTDTAAPSIERHLLASPGLPERLIAPVIDAAGRSQASSLVPLVLAHSRSQNPEVRAAVLRFLSRRGEAALAGRVIVLGGMDDDIEFVRVNAVRAARKQPLAQVLPTLTERLGDPSWWVRKGASETLAAMGPVGEEALFAAAQTHPDRFARDMAAQVIVDSGLLPTSGTNLAA